MVVDINILSETKISEKVFFTNLQVDNYGAFSGGRRKKVARTAGAIINLSIFLVK